MPNKESRLQPRHTKHKLVIYIKSATGENNKLFLVKGNDRECSAVTGRFLTKEGIKLN
jgi:hypothetical protein